jgi:hypothetical protein
MIIDLTVELTWNAACDAVRRDGGIQGVDPHLQVQFVRDRIAASRRTIRCHDRQSQQVIADHARLGWRVVSVGGAA